MAALDQLLFDGRGYGRNVTIAFIAGFHALTLLIIVNKHLGVLDKVIPFDCMQLLEIFQKCYTRTCIFFANNFTK